MGIYGNAHIQLMCNTILPITANKNNLISNNISFRYDNKIENETIIGSSSKKLYGKNLGVVEWITDHEWLNEHEEVSLILQNVYQNIAMIGKYSLYLVAWTTHLNKNQRINSYLLKKDKSLTKMVLDKNELYRTDKKTGDMYSAKGHKDFQEFYCPSEDTPIRWGYIPLSNDMNYLSICAITLLSLPANSLVIAAEGELPESILTEEVLYSIRYPEKPKAAFHPNNWRYETISPQIYSNKRIILKFGRPSDIEICIEGICHSSTVDLLIEHLVPSGCVGIF